MNYAYQCCLSGTLNAVEANEEWRWLLAFRSVGFSVFGDPVEDEGHTVFRLVVNDFGHLAGWRIYVECVCMRV